MTKTEVLDVLKENRDARGEANWKEMGDRTGGLTSFGIGLTTLRAIAKQVGRDHDTRTRVSLLGPATSRKTKDPRVRPALKTPTAVQVMPLLELTSTFIVSRSPRF